MIAAPILIPIPIPAGHHPLPVWALITLIVIGAIALTMGAAVVVIMVKDAIKGRRDRRDLERELDRRRRL